MNKKPILSALFSICSLMGAIPPTLQNVSPTESLASLRKYAFENRSDLQAALEVTRQREAQEYAILMKHFPQITLSTNVQKSQKDTLPEQQLQLSLSQALFAPATIYLPHKLAGLGTQTSKIQERLQQNNAQLELEQAFFDLQNISAKKALKETLKMATPVITERAQIQLHNGLISPVEFQEQMARYASASASIVQIGQGNIIAQKRLELTAERTGLKEVFWISAHQIRDAINKVLGKDRKIIIEQSLVKRPDRELLDYAARQAELQSIINKTNYLPTASLFATMYATKRANTALATAETLINYPWVVGVNFSWNFDSLSKMFSGRASHAEYLSQILKKKRTDLTIQQEVDESFRLLETDLSKLEAAKQTYMHGKKAFEQKILEFDMGLIAQGEFLAAKTSWDQVQADYVQVTTDAGKNYARFNFRTGNQLPLTIDTPVVA